MGNEKVGLGLAPDPFKTAINRYGLWPLTVWTFNMQERFTQVLKGRVGDGCEMRLGSGKQGYRQIKRPGPQKSARKGCFADVDLATSKTLYRITESTFNPAIALTILKMFAPKEGVVYDPFAGGGTRAIAACKIGLKYVGVELRKEEALEIQNRAHNNGITDGLTIIVGDSREVSSIDSSSADFLITCPPYWNLETYNGGECDLSMAPTYDKFLDMIEEVVVETGRILKSGALSCWIVGLHREDDGELLPLNHDISSIHRRLGFKMREEVILHITGQGLERRVGNFERGKKLLIRNHEYLLIFAR